MSAGSTTICSVSARPAAPRPAQRPLNAHMQPPMHSSQIQTAAAAAMSCSWQRQVSRRRCCQLTAAAGSTEAAVAQAATSANQLPRNPAAMVDQAAAAVQAALDDGRLRQQLTFILPVNEKEANFNNTEPIDYPCSLQKEFDTVCSLTKSLLQRLLGADTPLKSQRIDDGGVEGEPCAVLYPADKSFLAVVFPTADRLKQIQSYAKQEGRPLLIVNAQWRNEGQVITDFGWGPFKKAADDFLATFEQSYFLREKRIGSPGTINAATGTRFTTGGVVRVLRQFPGQYQNYAMAPDGSSQLLTQTAAEPSYKELDAMIRQGRQQKLEIFEIAQKVTYVYTDGTAADEAAMQPGGGVAAPAGDAAAAEAGGAGWSGSLASLSDADIEAMDAATLRRLLLAAGQPASGKISKLRERLREVRDAA